jgi:valyl-tRNA synthetase
MDGRPPFHEVFLHGLVRDASGKKMSKSRGNVIDPVDWLDRYGADSLRFTLARGAHPGADLALAEDWARGSRNFGTTLWNASRFALRNGATIGDIPERARLTDADTWLLDRADALVAEGDGLFEGFQVGTLCAALYHFVGDEFCDWYVELAKVQLAEGGHRAETTRAVLGQVLDVVLRLLHPVVPFVTETLWSVLTGCESIVVAPWPTSQGRAADADAARRVEDVQSSSPGSGGSAPTKDSSPGSGWPPACPAWAPPGWPPMRPRRGPDLVGQCGRVRHPLSISGSQLYRRGGEG